MLHWECLWTVLAFEGFIRGVTAPDVHDHVALCCEARLAVLTLEALLGCMGAHVALQRALLREEFLTQVTLKWFLLCVYPGVARQIAHRRKSSLTVFTRIRLISGVNTHDVPRTTALVRERVLTLIAGKRSLLGMDSSNVTLQISLFTKRFLAAVTRERFLLFAVVSLLVSLQVSLAGEASLTDVALELSVFHDVGTSVSLQGAAESKIFRAKVAMKCLHWTERCISVVTKEIHQVKPVLLASEQCAVLQVATTVHGSFCR